jgi:hypothetical protein
MRAPHPGALFLCEKKPLTDVMIPVHNAVVLIDMYINIRG